MSTYHSETDAPRYYTQARTHTLARLRIYDNRNVALCLSYNRNRACVYACVCMRACAYTNVCTLFLLDDLSLGFQTLLRRQTDYLSCGFPQPNLFTTFCTCERLISWGSYISRAAIEDRRQHCGQLLRLNSFEAIYLIVIYASNLVD